jgi:pyridoxal 5'-phosphate synthase pdxS subunit
MDVTAAAVVPPVPREVPVSSSTPAGSALGSSTPGGSAPDGSAGTAGAASTTTSRGTARVKRGMAEMLKGGVIMDVVTPEQAKIAEDAGAVAVMALERVPADIRSQGGVARMSDPDMVDGIISAVSIPVMAKARIGHFVEAQVLQSLGVDYIDESEVLTPADEANHIDKWAFTVPFVCGATNLGEALRRLSEGAAMIRSKGEAGTGNVVEATRHMRALRAEIRRLTTLAEDELYVAAKELRAPYDLVKDVAEAGKLPVVLFTAGGIATPADAAMMMQLGAEGVFVGSGIFKAGNPAQRAEAIVKATTFHDDPDVIAKVSRGLGEAMVGINLDSLPQSERYAGRGW